LFFTIFYSVIKENYSFSKTTEPKLASKPKQGLACFGLACEGSASVDVKEK
jgi:hypothetical protein